MGEILCTYNIDNKYIDTYTSSKSYSLKQGQLCVMSDTIIHNDNKRVNLMKGNPYIYGENNKKYMLAPNEIIEYIKENGSNIYGFYLAISIENNEIIIMNDFLASYPLYYCVVSDGFIFCDDIQELEQAKYKKIHRLESGSKLIYSINDNKIKIEKYISLNIVDTTKNTLENFDRVLRSATLDLFKFKTGGNEKVTAFLSGGVDSSLIAYYLSCISKNLKALTIDGKDTHFAKQVAHHLDIEHTIIAKTDEEIKQTAKLYTVNKDSEYYGLSRTLFTPTFLLAEKAKEIDSSCCFMGTGSDELFAGYAQSYEFVEGLEASTKKLLDNAYLFIMEPTYYAMASNRMIYAVPFFSREVVEYALSLEDKWKNAEGYSKWIVRKVAENYIPKENAWREANPFQESTKSFRAINGKSYYQSVYY